MGSPHEKGGHCPLEPSRSWTPSLTAALGSRKAELAIPAEDTELRRGEDSPGPTTGPRASSQASCSTQGSVDSTPGREVEGFLPLRAPQPQ